MSNKGYYISKKNKDEIILNIYTKDFISYLENIANVNGWVKFKIYERDKPAINGLTHNMELIEFRKDIDKNV
jgi:hypothetical protein